VGEWLADEVENQVRFRDFNEWIKASNDRLPTDRVDEEFICECSDGTCRQVIMLTRLEYESVRANGARFAIALNHETQSSNRCSNRTSGSPRARSFRDRG
jgi:hypothetical protein